MCVCVSVVRARLRETQRLPARMRRGVGLGTGRGLRLRRGLGPGPRPEVPEACQGSPRQRAPPPPPPSPVLWFPGSRMRRGSRAARRQPRSAAGVGAPATHPGRGWEMVLMDHYHIRFSPPHRRACGILVPSSRDQTRVSCIWSWVLTTGPPGKSWLSHWFFTVLSQHRLQLPIEGSCLMLPLFTLPLLSHFI